MAQQAVFTALQRGSSIVVDEAKYLFDVFDKLESAKKQLESMQAFLKGVMAMNLVSEVRGVAQDVEDIIDRANILRRQRDQKASLKGVISKYASFPIYLFHLHRIGVRIEATTTRMKTIFEDFDRHNIVASAIAEEQEWGLITKDDAIQQWRSSTHPDLGKHVDVIGFNEKIHQIKSDLLDRLNIHLSVFSIVGPGGAGKSTMASKVYSLDAVNRCFDVRAWVTVSQRFVARELLKEMVITCTMGVPKAEEIGKKTQSEMKKILRDFLYSRKYLIVLDDIWGTNVWDMISDAFPDNKNGSRVILTTRNEAVAKHPYAMTKIYTPKLLNEKESTQLLLRVAFPEYILDGSMRNNPEAMGQNLDDLKKVGKNLAKKCCGLPLALVVLGGHLSKNPDIAEWRRLTSRLDWHALINTGSIIGAILDLSYFDMPSHLRSCFMYTTAFPEDSPIDARLLCNLWIAEGFIPLVRGYTREEVAVRYITELAQRCMIQVEERTSSGRISLIKVHDVLRDWGTGRARKQGLIKDCHDVEDIEADYSEEMMKAYRVVLHGLVEMEFGISMRKLRTLLDIKLSSLNNKVHVSKNFEILRHLRVLYLHGSREDVHLPSEISSMRYLRYLGLGGTCYYHLPSSIGDLLSLETLDASAGQIHSVPISLWKILTLKHVHISSVRCWSVPPISSQSMMRVTVFCSVLHSACNNNNPYNVGGVAKQVVTEEAEKQLSAERKPNLSYCFVVKHTCDFVYQLEIVGRCKVGDPFCNDLADFKERRKITVLKICCANLLSNQQKLMEVAWMQTLQVLEIGDRSYTGSVLSFPDCSFISLRRFVLHDLPVEEWKIEGWSMINLQELTLCKCHNLRYLPKRLLLLPRLKNVNLIAMPTSCYRKSTVSKGLENKGCEVTVSLDEKDFKHIDMPISKYFCMNLSAIM